MSVVPLDAPTLRQRVHAFFRGEFPLSSLDETAVAAWHNERMGYDRPLRERAADLAAVEDVPVTRRKPTRRSLR